MEWVVECEKARNTDSIVCGITEKGWKMKFLDLCAFVYFPIFFLESGFYCMDWTIQCSHCLDTVSKEDVKLQIKWEYEGGEQTLYDL